MTKLVKTADLGRLQNNYEICDDFFTYTSLDTWTTTIDTSATVAVDADGLGGLLLITTHSDDNDAACIESPELFKFAADKPIEFEARVNFTEANTDDANIAVGFCDAPSLDAPLGDDGAYTVNDSGAVIYKVDGGTKWIFSTEIGGTAVTTTSDHTAGGAFQRLGIKIQPKTATELSAVPFLDGAQMLDANGNLIEHTITLGTATEMAVVAAAKAGGANLEVLTVDYIYAAQTR